MGDVREILITGNAFTEAVARIGVPKADQVSATIEAEPQPRKIPNLMQEALAGLNPKPADRAERSSLIGELHEVWGRCQAFYDRELEREYAGLIEADEAAKEAVNAQRAVFDKLKAQLQEDAVELVNLQNSTKVAAGAEQNAIVERQSLSRFASAKQIKEAERRIADTKQKFEEAQRKAAEHHERLNYFQNVTLRKADEKLIQLIEAELEISARLEGRDPFIAAHTAITRDSEAKAQRFI
ncbi:MAG TPA: hypothetical protein VN087_02670 [Verrucomicrobiae bacterium]|jgi:hypothetical protein|nr:hypothetical protein [Verrucomicrobiae bacterium]